MKAKDRFGSRPRRATLEPPPPPPRTADAGWQANPYDALLQSPNWLDAIRATMSPPVTTITRFAGSEFPEALIRIPDDWSSVVLAPLYDAHVGSKHHDGALFQEHLAWIAGTPNVLSWSGGDLLENASKVSPGSGVYEQIPPHEQIKHALAHVATVRHKLIALLAGNHEDRLLQLGVDVSEWLAQVLGVPYFPGYAMLRLLWRGQALNVFAHHGAGSAQTAGAQMLNIRRELPWAHGFDLYWFGHLHRSLHAKEMRVMHDPETNRVVAREAYVIMSPSYLKSFGGSYAERKRLAPTTRGMVIVEWQPSGRLDLQEHAAGKRF